MIYFSWKIFFLFIRNFYEILKEVWWLLSCMISGLIFPKGLATKKNWEQCGGNVYWNVWKTWTKNMWYLLTHLREYIPEFSTKYPDRLQKVSIAHKHGRYFQTEVRLWVTVAHAYDYQLFIPVNLSSHTLPSFLGNISSNISNIHSYFHFIHGGPYIRYPYFFPFLHIFK